MVMNEMRLSGREKLNFFLKKSFKELTFERRARAALRVWLWGRVDGTSTVGAAGGGRIVWSGGRLGI